MAEVQGDEVGETPTLRTILKFPQQPHGMSYIGALIIPRNSFSFLIKVCCAEQGTTGVRDNVVFARLHLDATPAFDPEDPLPGWFQDPYDATFKAPILRNRSDDEEWDVLFPQHPLSRVRYYMAEIKRTIQLDESVRHSEPFDGPGAKASRKGWWGRLTGR